ncbi:hypothetical protein Slin15195_G115750 [Septoria linicola]|uniref:Uncharacterized protein n=1 Tax=Septoria linicola TaxID=215465 RepID=A0A9Q9B8D8_9PEZI|nr:hypothetical protein Slin15195_G115750 [Septoria linicola]
MSRSPRRRLHVNEPIVRRITQTTGNSLKCDGTFGVKFGRQGCLIDCMYHLTQASEWVSNDILWKNVIVGEPDEEYASERRAVRLHGLNGQRQISDPELVEVASLHCE